MFTAIQIHQYPNQGSLPLNIQPNLFQPLLQDQMGSCVRRLAGDYLGTIEYRWTTWGLLWDYLGGSIALGLLHWVAPLGLLFSIKVQWVSFQRMDLKITMHLWWVSYGLTPLCIGLPQLFTQQLIVSLIERNAKSGRDGSARNAALCPEMCFTVSPDKQFMDRPTCASRTFFAPRYQSLVHLILTK